MSFFLRQARLYGQLIKGRTRPETYWCEPDVVVGRAVRRLVTDGPTFDALFRWDAVRICDALDTIGEGPPILPGSGLVKLEGTDQIYFLDGGSTRFIDDWLAFERCNFHPEKVKGISRSAFAALDVSTPLSRAYRDVPLRYGTFDIHDDDWAIFVDALKALKGAGRYDLLIQVHSDNINEIHSMKGRNVNFLPWHRVFLLELNRMIQDVIGNPTVGFPYFWSWALDASRSGHRGDLWKDDRLGGSGTPVGTGPFRAAQWPTMSPDRQSYFQDGLIRTLEFERFPTKAEVTTLLGESRFENFTYDLELGVHSWIHKGIGGHMRDLKHSPNEPAFWLHHGNVDRIWSRWQRNHPTEDARVQAEYQKRNLPPSDLHAGTRQWTIAEACRLDRTAAGYPAIDEWSTH